MPTRGAQARWEGGLRGGKGKMKFGSGAFEGNYSFGSRFENGTGTNPEELIGAAHAGCFSMALAAMLEQAGHAPTWIETSAAVTVEKVGEDFSITKSRLTTRAVVPGIEESAFLEIAGKAKKGCPVSRALAGVEITLDAKLES
jgi:lipoyl-dependent peroxiredoxin